MRFYFYEGAFFIYQLMIIFSYRLESMTEEQHIVNDSVKYEMIIYWSDDDSAYIVEVPELPGCMADGSTPEEAIKNTRKVIAEWIETAKELGREIPKPKGRLIYA